MGNDDNSSIILAMLFALTLVIAIGMITNEAYSAEGSFSSSSGSSSSEQLITKKNKCFNTSDMASIVNSLGASIRLVGEQYLSGADKESGITEPYKYFYIVSDDDGLFVSILENSKTGTSCILSAGSLYTTKQLNNLLKQRKL